MTVTCVCSKCDFKTHSIPGKQHRRCSGQVKGLPRDKHAKIEKNARGTWEAR